MSAIRCVAAVRCYCTQIRKQKTRELVVTPRTHGVFNCIRWCPLFFRVRSRGSEVALATPCQLEHQNTQLPWFIGTHASAAARTRARVDHLHSSTGTSVNGSQSTYVLFFCVVLSSRTLCLRIGPCTENLPSHAMRSDPETFCARRPVCSYGL